MSDAHTLQSRAESKIAPIALDKAVFISLWMEAIFYGVFVVLFVGTMYALVYKRSTERVNRPMLYTAVAILLLATAHLLLDLVRCLQAFMDAPLEGSTSLAYFGNIAHPTHLAKTAVMVTETCVADSLLVYRVYIVWMRNPWVPILPALLVLSTGIAGYAVVYYLGSLAGTGASVFASELKHWITSFFCITLVTNVICTLLIAFRIWNTHRGSFQAGGNLNSVIQVVVESGAIYSASLVIMITVYLLGSNAQYTVLDPLAPLIGIVFSLIIIRVAMGLSHGGSGHAKHTSGQTRSLSVFQAQSQQHSIHPMKPLAVQVTQGVHSHSDPATIADITITHSVSSNKGAGYSDEELEYHHRQVKGGPRAY